MATRILIAVLILAYFNGVNKYFKGVATLWESKTLRYKTALIVATISTFAGTVCSFYFATALINSISGKGLMPDNTIQPPYFVLAITLATGAAVYTE
ncbi:MAG: hypothetical protein SGI96_09555 [Bacteroidota bacterium]|nr:hypothetical protein [Bacteroidota bacterium]